MPAQRIIIVVCARCLDGDGECHDPQCTFWQTTPLTPDQAAAVDRNRQLHRDDRRLVWLEDIG